MSEAAQETAAQTYRRQAIMTASREKLVVMLFDGALRFVERTRLAIENNEVGPAGESLSRAFAIVSELRGALDKDQGGDLAQDLDRLYGFVLDRLVATNRKRALEPLDEARQILVTLKSGFDGAFGNG